MNNTYSCLTGILATALALGASSGMLNAGAVEIPFQAAHFTAPQDNAYLPMAIGATYVYGAEEEDGLVMNEITQTAQTKTILGVQTIVVHDVEWLIVEGVGPVKTEETSDWLAWDNSGNVWYFGEDTTEFLYDDDWNPVGTSPAGSWEAGVDGAQPGILMLADPKPGAYYRQEYYADEAEDMGQVLKLNARVSIELGDFEDCLKTKEWTPLERGAIEHKFYAPGVGLVFIEELKGKTVKVELVGIH